MSVPIFIDSESNNQVEELRVYLNSKGANISEPTSDATSIEVDLSNVIKAADILWKDQSNDTDIELIYNSMITMVIGLDKNERLVTSFSNELAVVGEGRHNLIKLRLLNNLFSGLDETSQLRSTVYSNIIKLAADADLLSHVSLSLEDLKVFSKKWSLSVSQYQELLRQLHNVYKQNDKGSKIMVELLSTYAEVNAADAREDARSCIVACIGDPSVLIFDHLLALKPVKFLEGEPTHNLLTLFVNGRLPQYLSFYESNKDFVNSKGLNHAANIKKMKILTFLQMASQKTTLSFEELQAELNITIDEVEPFIIDVIRNKAATLTIDRLQRKIVVSTCLQRTFGKAQWQLLRERLDTWCKNINSVVSQLKSLDVAHRG